uniref:Uncharacterized protein n=1 Tax=Arundo donax TaxID=35708 RepID=A0A0A9BXQ7_ARUDO
MVSQIYNLTWVHQLQGRGKFQTQPPTPAAFILLLLIRDRQLAFLPSDFDCQALQVFHQMATKL